MKKSENTPKVMPITLDAKPDKAIALRAYLFDRQGKLLQTTDVKNDEARRVRVAAGPPLGVRAASLPRIDHSPILGRMVISAGAQPLSSELTSHRMATDMRSAIRYVRELRDAAGRGVGTEVFTHNEGRLHK